MKTKCQLLEAGSINYSFCLYVCAAASSQTQKSIKKKFRSLGNIGLSQNNDAT